jgi:hypothetical protein
MVVNGDDILFTCRDSQHYNIWKEITGFCGLKFSVGKNYTHKRFLVINSELYKVTRSDQAKRLPIINYRLIYGGSRSSPEGISLRPIDQKAATSSLRVRFDENHFQAYHDYHMPLQTAEELREKQFRDSRLAALEGLDLQLAIRSKLSFRQFTLERPMRLEGYKKWFLTLPQRQQTYIQQVKGDYGVNDEELEKVMELFRSVQFRIYVTHKNEFPSIRDKFIPWFLPRHLGGLGFQTPRHHKYTQIDRVLAQTLKEQPGRALEFVKAMTPGLQTSSMMRNLNGMIGRIRDTLGLEETLVPIPEWDEFLERHGMEDLSCQYGVNILYAFSDVDAHIDQDMFVSAYEEAKLDQRYRFKNIKSILREVRVRHARMTKEAKKIEGGIDKLLASTTKISDESWCLRIHRVQPRLP